MAELHQERQFQISLANEAEPWLAALARRTNRLVVEIERLFAADPEALLDEIVAVRLDLIHHEVAEMLGYVETKNTQALTAAKKRLRKSATVDDRLTLALYERARATQKST